MTGQIPTDGLPTARATETEAGCSVLRFESVSKRYSGPGADVDALKGVTLEIEEGEFVVILGPSGSGKTTLLCLAAGLERPTAGRVFLSGRDFAELSENELSRVRRKDIGFVFQMFHLVQGLSAWENTALPLRFGGVPRREARIRATDLLNQVGLSSRSSHYPSQLSGGEMQRVGLARALASNPPLILADEPTGHLDRANGDLLLQRLRGITKARRGTVVLVTHDERAVSYGDRVLGVVDGRLSGDNHAVLPEARSTAP